MDRTYSVLDPGSPYVPYRNNYGNNNENESENNSVAVLSRSQSRSQSPYPNMNMTLSLSEEKMEMEMDDAFKELIEASERRYEVRTYSVITVRTIEKLSIFFYSL